MDPELAAILARYGLDSLDDLRALTADSLTGLHGDLLALAHARMDGAADDPAMLASAVEAASTTLDFLESHPHIVASAANQLERRAASMQSRVPASMLPRQRGRQRAGSVLTAGGRALPDDALVELLADALRQASRGRVGFQRVDGLQLVASVKAAPVLPLLGRDSEANRETIERAVGAHVSAIKASGGLCAPPAILYDLPVLPVSDRPLRDALVQFLADRGGVRILPGPSLSDVDDGVAVWTEANDVDPSDPTTKPHVTMTCPDEVEAIVDAITAILRVGNFAIRYQAELVQRWITTLMAAQARLAETRLLELIDADSTSVSAEQVLGASRDILTTVDRAIAHLRYRGRFALDSRFVCVLPAWAEDVIRTDLVRELPGASSERLATADATIATFFSSRGVTPVWSLDACPLPATQVDAEPLNAWPDSVTLRLWPAGAWMHLDGGTLDLGIVRDTVLNQTNDAEMFSETFESAIKLAGESLVIDVDICPNGATATAIDIDPCTTGS